MKYIVVTTAFVFFNILLSCKNKEENKEVKYIPSTGVFTGSDGREYPTVIIDGVEFMTRNLDVDTFLNGDPIPEATTEKEWQEAAKKQKPAWCYYDNDAENGKKLGKIYNYFTFEDPRGVLPEGWRVVDSADWNRLENFCWDNFPDQSFAAVVKSKDGWLEGEEGSDATGLSLMPAGSRRANGKFEDKGLAALFWSPVEYNDEDNYVFYFSGDPNYQERHLIKYSILNKGNGFSVRLARNVKQ